MACCEYRDKNELIVPKEVSFILIIFLSVFLLSGIIIFLLPGLFSDKFAKIVSFCYWSLISLCTAPGLFLTRWKINLSARTFNFSPFLSGYIYKNSPLLIILFIDVFILLLSIKIFEIILSYL
ncbi:hypothetical protein HZA55_04195 [Candidatus Poribacteria bacterium]|nr:hypothetical protein [Candidatus Poribacteria bacterium]